LRNGQDGACPSGKCFLHTACGSFAWDDGRKIQTWSQRQDDQKWLWGGTVSVGLQFGLTPHVYLHAAGGYDWVEDCELAIGPDRIRLDLDGYRAELALGWRFGGR